MLRSLSGLGLLYLALCLPASAAELSLAVEGAAITGAPLQIQVDVGGVADGEEMPIEILVDGVPVDLLRLESGTHIVGIDAALAAGSHLLTARSGDSSQEIRLRVLPGWLSVLPPLVAIGLALLFKDVLFSLFAGLYFGALLLFGWNPVTAFARSIDRFVAPALADADNASILIFSTLLGGMVGVISKSGGTQGIVNRLADYATNARRGQVATWLLGILIFFDDYANTLIVGSTMRPITDRLRISREKLAYIVDSTAAPIASVVPISTWIGFEIGLIATSFEQLDLPYNAYTTFVASILYRFYPILALVLGFTIAFTCRDFGPMLRAERRTSETGRVVGEMDVPLADFDESALAPPKAAPRRALNALLPVSTVIVVTVVGLLTTGAATVDRGEYSTTFQWLREVFSNSDSYRALLWASLGGVLVAMLLALLQRILTVREATAAMVRGFKAMLLALIVLLLAWSLGDVCDQLHTADYLVELSSGVLLPQWLPVLVFLLSAGTSFATGSSWGAMGILMPLVIPISHGLSVAAGYAVGSEGFYLFLVGTISSVLAGSVWGDHCSPISDTTILSSMASGCDHIAHVRTQMPYALAVGFVAMLVGDIPTAYGMSPWLSLLIGSVIIVGLVRWFGKRSDWAIGDQKSRP
jgi:Na+/H+ antiporter NhaC